MSAEDFHVIDDSEIWDQIIKTDFLKLCHQRGARINKQNQIFQILLWIKSKLYTCR